MARYALVVGIEEYDDKQHLGNLSNSVADAEGIAAILRDCGHCPQNQSRILSGRVTGQEFLDTLKEFLKLAKNQEAIIYFSGHGVLEKKWDDVDEKYIDKGYLVASNCQISKKNQELIIKNPDSQNNERGAISLEDIVKSIDKANLSKLVLILDSCHSGSPIDEVEASFGSIQKINTCYFIAACQSFESSWSKGSKRHSEFTGFFLEALNKKNVDENNTITIDTAIKLATNALENSGDFKTNKGRQKIKILRKGDDLPLVTYPVTSLFKANPSQSVEISDDDIKILKPHLQPIDRYVLAWAVMEGISVYALKQWLDSDRSLGVESFLAVVREQFPQQPDGTSSLISVLKTLVNHPEIKKDENTHEKIIQWLQHVNSEIILDDTIDFKKQLKAYLFIVIEQEGPKDPLSLTAQLKIENKIPIPLNVQSNQQSSYPSHPDRPGVVIGQLSEDDNLKDKVYPYLQELLNRRCDPYLRGIPLGYELVIEIFLPFDYLAESVDLWLIKKRRYQRELGRNYPVIVRSYERLIDRECENILRQRWNQMKSIEQKNLSNHIKHLEKNPDYDYGHLEDELRKQRSIGLSCFLPKTSAEREELFVALHETGVPLALWLRSPNLEGDYLNYFNGLLCSDYLQQNCDRLMKKLFKLRQEAHLNQNPQVQWAYHAALLLDNPDRFPSRNPFKFGK